MLARQYLHQICCATRGSVAVKRRLTLCHSNAALRPRIHSWTTVTYSQAMDFTLSAAAKVPLPQKPKKAAKEGANKNGGVKAILEHNTNLTLDSEQAQASHPPKIDTISSSSPLGASSENPVVLKDTPLPSSPRVKVTSLAPYELARPASPGLSNTLGLPIRASRKKTPKPSPNISGGHPTQRERDSTGRDRKVIPSLASGGVPNPTNAYLRVANEISWPLDVAQHLLVVIDLNGTLLFRPSKSNPTKFIARPNALLFLKYCIETFNVIIWSSAKAANVNAMCDAIMTTDLRSKVTAVWARERFGLSSQDFVKRVMCYKRLTSLWGTISIAESHPNYALGARWDQTNTVLIDDSLEKGRAEPFNLIEVPEWSGDMNDFVLPTVHDYLNFLATHSNVSSSLRSNPFKAILQDELRRQ